MYVKDIIYRRVGTNSITAVLIYFLPDAQGLPKFVPRFSKVMT